MTGAETIPVLVSPPDFARDTVQSDELIELITPVSVSDLAGDLGLLSGTAGGDERNAFNRWSGSRMVSRAFHPQLQGFPVNCDHHFRGHERIVHQDTEERTVTQALAPCRVGRKEGFAIFQRLSDQD